MRCYAGACAALPASGSRSVMTHYSTLTGCNAQPSVHGTNCKRACGAAAARAGEDMLDGAPAGQREAARRALQAKRVELVTGALVSGVERLDARAAPGPPDAGPDAGRRLVHLKASSRAGHEVRPAGLLPVIGVNRTLVSRLKLQKQVCNFVEVVDRAGARAPSAQPGAHERSAALTQTLISPYPHCRRGSRRWRRTWCCGPPEARRPQAARTPATRAP